MTCFMNEGPMFEHVKHPNVLNRNTAWDISLWEYLLQSFFPLKNTQCLRRTKPLPVPPSLLTFIHQRPLV